MRTRPALAVVVALATVACRDKPPPATPPAAATGAPTADASTAPADRVAIARAFMDQLVKQDFDRAVQAFAPDLAKALGAKTLADAWRQSITALGAAQTVGETLPLALGERDVVIVRIVGAKGTLDARLSFKPGSDAIAGFNLDSPIVYTAPSYVDAAAYTEREIVVGTGKASLPGTLTMPVGAGPFPAVVLVHGSGPGDRDESLGPSRPFRDLALGLASNGVAVLRYEKRTRGWVAFLGVAPDALTIKEEYTDDVAAAVAVLRATATVDPAKLFVLGHSQGGMLTPMFLAADPQLAGGIVFSGNARRFEDLLVPQYTYLAGHNDGTVTPREQRAIDDVAAQVQRVKDPALSTKTDTATLPLGIAAAYWLSLRAYDQVAVAQTLPQPLLFLQGGRDFQVTAADDLARWQQGLATKANATFRLYPELNHAGMAGVAMTTIEYATVEGHVDIRIIEDVAAFVRK